MSDPNPKFMWNHDRLSKREDMFVQSAVMTFFITMVTQEQVQAGRSGKPIASDIIQAEKKTLSWFGHAFPDLDVRVAEG